MKTEMVSGEKRVKLPSHALYFAVVNWGFDTADISDRLPHGDWKCTPTLSVELGMARRIAVSDRLISPRFLPAAYRSQDLRRHREGQRIHALPPRRKTTRCGKSVHWFVRFDVDEHDGQEDGLQFIELLRSAIPKLYVERTARGYRNARILVGRALAREWVRIEVADQDIAVYYGWKRIRVIHNQLLNGPRCDKMV